MTKEELVNAIERFVIAEQRETLGKLRELEASAERLANEASKNPIVGILKADEIQAVNRDFGIQIGRVELLKKISLYLNVIKHN